ncbi:NAD(P)/FAD-dependent oxidoreductase [Antrihabitans stalactiti]|uniref:NAD(P)/FAD-dependent oxidoreductase n=1 Tax=Antrihabitans stalactiti TaxID=2584121 RepID=A0A848KCS5_9NOCA|nr:NAD(P)/FAD-dependent oxidoreductase [Antrihabitans stalactiti]NMN96683.1 NAD(P)/FAD-dependent oxidoreductase [Antrihabitans stalactiti]
MHTKSKHILIVGGGTVGMSTAIRLQKKLRAGEATITVVDPLPHMTYLPFLPEVSAGSIDPRHIVVPLRTVLRKCTVITGNVSKVEHSSRRAQITTPDGATLWVDYDILVMTAGSVARTLPVPGLADQGIMFKTVTEAAYLRDHVLSRLDHASTTDDAALRQRLLTFVVIGGGYAGIEALAELQDMARFAIRYYPKITAADMNWVLVEATDRIMPEVSPKMGRYTIERLTKRGIKVHLNTRAESLVDGNVELSDGTKFGSDTIVWTAGVKANPMLSHTDLPVDSRGRLHCSATLEVVGVTNAFGAGDISAVPDLSKIDDDPSATCSPSAQHAVRQAKVLADNVVALVRGKDLKQYSHKYAGSVASLGLHRGVADVYGMKIRGWPAWMMHRGYHVAKMPTFSRKVRIIADWTLAAFFRREIVALDQIDHPKAVAASVRALESARRAS